MSNFEYKLDSVRFDEYQRREIDQVFEMLKSETRELHLSLENPFEEKEKYRDLNRAQLSRITACSDAFEKLRDKFPRLGQVVEYKNRIEAIEQAKAQFARCESGVSRFDAELKKTFSRETAINNNLPFSELKAQYDSILEKFTALEFEKVESLELFNIALAGWFMSKTGFSFSDGEIVDLNDLKQANVEVFSWLKNKLYLNYLSKSFLVNIPDGREEWKCVIKKGDDLGKKLNLQLGELCIFESSLKPALLEKKYDGKFRYPEKMGQEYVPVGKYVSGKKTAVIETRKNNVKVVLPLYIGLLRVKIA